MQKIIQAALTFARDMKPTETSSGLGQDVKSWKSLLPLAALVASVVSVPLRADEQVPFRGQFSPVIVSATPIDDTHVMLNVDVTVRATHLGNAQGPGFAILDLTTFAYVGQVTWSAANGDEVFITFAGQFLLSDTPGIRENVETFEVVGGSGRFEGATGTGTAGGLLEAETLIPLTPAPFEATISSPGSLKK